MFILPFVQGNLLIQFFARSPISQADFARELGISPAHLSRLIRGERQPSLPLALRISALTGVPVAALVTRRVA